MSSGATDSGHVGRSDSSGQGSKWRYLALAAVAELPIALLALASSTTLGPTHPVTTAFGVFLLYATPFVGVAAFTGLVVDGGQSRHEDRGLRWRWYAATTLVLTGVLTYHAAGGSEGDAWFGLWEPMVALALSMVPVGAAYWIRGWSRRSKQVLAG
ncbi:hypothetical protein [Halorussus halophilus]|uniref:hypothetical protein n=1 Tax=Halorussus halophilus TaxID=2650975 RepID=UPI001300DB06|nr:hypothetical protein [Halorussus halophilus]